MGSIGYEEERGVVVITIDRPEHRNALDTASQRALTAALARFEADPGARVAILTGRGSVFCAGADLTEMASGVVPDPAVFPVPGTNPPITKPLIAAVNGAAFGAGFMLAQECDLCIAAHEARFAITEARWGRGAPYAAKLPTLIPPRVALELIVTARPISAARAAEVGLVNKVVEGAELMAEARTLARTIADNAPLSVQAGKAMVDLVVGASIAAVMPEIDERYRQVYASSDAQEGPRAFRDGRTPVWKGS